MTKGGANKKNLLFMVALGAVGFAVIEFLPAGNRAGQQPSAAQAESSANSAPNALPVSLSTDPFTGVSNEADAAKQPESAPPEASPPGGNSGPPPAMGGTLPSAGPWIPPLGMPGEAHTDPVKNAGENQQSEKKPESTVELQAIVAVTDRTAFLSVDGSDAAPHKKGSKVADGWTVLKIAENEVVFARGKDRARVTVGGKTNL